MECFLDILVYCSRLLTDFISSSDFSVCSCSFFVVNISSFFDSKGQHFTRQAWWEVQSIDREKSAVHWLGAGPLTFRSKGVNHAVTFSIQSFRVLFQGQEKKIQILLMLVCKDIICA